MFLEIVFKLDLTPEYLGMYGRHSIVFFQWREGCVTCFCLAESDLLKSYETVQKQHIVMTCCIYMCDSRKSWEVVVDE